MSFHVTFTPSPSFSATFGTNSEECHAEFSPHIVVPLVDYYDGVYGYSISNAGALTVRRRYNSSYSLTIDGNFKISTYTLDLPSGLYLFD